MDYKIERPQKEIDDVLNKASAAEEKGTSNWPGMTYEQGVKNAILWLTGDYDDNPMAD